MRGRPRKKQQGFGSRCETLEPRTLLAATVIDVMVLYDTDAKSKFGNSDAAIQKAIAQSIDIANLAHQNTGDNVVLRLCRTQFYAYSNAGAPQATQLAALEADATVAGLRTTYGADLVSMIIQPAEGGGLGDLLTSPTGSPSQAFNVVDYGSVGPGSLVLAHEFGHNMGAAHERDNVTPPSQGAFSYGYGYHTAYTGPSAHGTDYGDVMSYKGAGLPVFATPNYIHDGVALGRPIGGANPSDLQTAFTNIAPYIAGYKNTAVADAPPAAVLWQTDLAGNQLTFQVRYTDDISISAASLGNGDVYVQTPEGYHLQAEYIGADVAGDGYARTASYRVTLPNNSPAVSSLSFYMNASQVKDTNNAFIPTGQLANNVDGDLDRGLVAWQLARDLGNMNADSTRRVTNNVEPLNDRQDIYRFTVAANMNLRVTLSGSGPTGGPTLFMYKDANLNEVSNAGEGLGNSLETGTADRSVTVALTAGTYYVYIQLDPAGTATTYTLSLSTTSTESNPPTATLDAVDNNAGGTITSFSVLYSDDSGISASTLNSANIGVVFSGTVNGSGTTGSPTSTTVLSPKQIYATYTTNWGIGLTGATITVKIDASSGLKDIGGTNIVTGVTLGSFKFTSTDTTVPTASINSAPALVVPPAITTYDFTIAYKDNRPINSATIDGSDIVVTGPNSFSQAASLVAGSITTSPSGSITYATYRITAPGGSWSYADNGTYTLTMQLNQVKDPSNNSVANGSLGTFSVAFPYPGDANGDKATNFTDLVALAQNYDGYGRGVANGDFNFDGVVDFSDLVLLAQNYDSVFAAPVPAALAFSSDETLAAVNLAPTGKSAPVTKSRPAPVIKPKPAPVPRPSPRFATAKIIRSRNDLLA